MKTLNRGTSALGTWELGCTTFCSPRGTHGLEKMPHQVMFDCGLLSSGRSAEAFYSTKDPMFEIG
jgi:hypothetical protein